MAIPFDQKKTDKFVTRADKKLPEAEQSRFICQPLSQDDFDELELKYSGTDKVSSMARIRQTVRMALVGWENYAAKFETNGDGRATDETLKRISPKDLLDLFHFINKKEILEPEDAGK